MAASWQQFVSAAQDIARQEGFPVGLVLAQAAQETGRNPNNAAGNNWFGIKGSGSAGSNNLATQEEASGKRYNVRSNFAAYQSPEDAVKSYINLIKTGPAFQSAWKQYQKDQNPFALVKNISAHYATDSNYASNVINTPEFQNYLNSPDADNYYKTVQSQQGNNQQSQPSPTPTIAQVRQSAIPTPQPSQNYQPNQVSQGKTWDDYAGTLGMQSINDIKMAQDQGKVPVISAQTNQLTGFKKSSTPPPGNLFQQIMNTIMPDANAKETTMTPTYNTPQPGIDVGGTKRTIPGLYSQSSGYTVQPGDTLWGIAQKTLGNGNRWNELLGYGGSPSSLPVGQKITIPAQANYAAPRIPPSVGSPSPQPTSTPANANATSAKTGQPIYVAPIMRPPVPTPTPPPTQSSSGAAYPVASLADGKTLYSDGSHR